MRGTQTALIYFVTWLRKFDVIYMTYRFVTVPSTQHGNVTACVF